MANKPQFDAQTLLKHHYWIVASLAGLALPIFWYVAVDGLAETFTKGKSARDTVRQQVDSFQTGGQPNPEINTELDKRRGHLTEEVYKAWKFQYERQQPYMQWDLQNMWNRPLLSLLTPAQAEAFENARIKGAELDPSLRSAYHAWLVSPKDLPAEDAAGAVQFDHVKRLIGLRRPIMPKDDEREKEKGKEGAGKADPRKLGKVGVGAAPGGVVGGLGGENRRDRGDAVQHEGLVYWPESERHYLENKFGKGGAWDRAPSTAQVIYTHESMNVYALLLSYVVAQTNGEQTEHQLLAIKKIVTIRLGEDCQPPTKEAGAAAGAGGGPAPPGGGGGPPAGGGGPPAGGGGPPAGGGGPPGGGAGPLGGGAVGRPGEGKGQGGADATPAFALGTLGGGGANKVGAGGGGEVGGRKEAGSTPPDGRYRYVDDEGFAVADPEAQPFAEFRMLPVVMRFVMDQRRLPEVLANCVQSPLPIHVKQLNMRDPRGEIGRGAAEAPKGVGGPGAGGPAGGGTGGGGTGGGVAPARAEGGENFGGEIELGPYDQEIEIKGIIYIYNPPDLTKVGTGAEAPAIPADKVPADPSAKSPASPEGPSAKTPAEKSPAAKSEAEKAAATEKVGSEKTTTESAGVEKTGTAKTGAEKTGAEKTGAEKTGAEKAGPEKTVDPPPKASPPKPAPPADGVKAPAAKS